MGHLTVTEVAAALHVSPLTVKRYIYDGKLASVKLPGGQHRIPEEEVERLLTQHAPGGAEPLSVPDAGLEERVAVLERWVAEQEAELERVSAGLQVLAAFCARTPGAHRALAPVLEGDPPEPVSQLLVLGPGCRRCAALFELTRKVVAALGMHEVEVARVEDLDAIAAYGPVITPALVMGDHLLVSGRVPSEGALRKLLERHLA